jgi:EAL domain-containing protein (putative c-di-GMP-specific phosphodiesterase class I)/integral membrane sensor domain MASE1
MLGPHVDSVTVPPHPRVPSTHRAKVFLIAKIALLVALVTLLSRALAFTDQRFSLIWPASGLGFAVLWVYGWRGLAGLALGLAGWAAMLHATSPGFILFAVTAGCIGPVIAVTTMRSRWVHRRWPMIERVSQGEFTLVTLAIFFLVQAMVAAPAAAAIGTYGLLFADVVQDGTPMAVFLSYWVIESLGAVLFAPLALAWLAARRHATFQPTLRYLLDLPTVALCAVVATAQIALHAHGETPYASVLVYLYFPLLAACAVRHVGVKPPLTLVVCVVLIITAHALDRPAVAGPVDNTFALIELTLVMFVIASMFQVLIAIMHERRRTSEELARSAQLCHQTGLLNESGFVALWTPFSTRERLLVGLHINNLGHATRLIGYEATRDVLRAVADSLRQWHPQTEWARLDGAVFAATIDRDDSPSAKLIETAIKAIEWTNGGRRVPLVASLAVLHVNASVEIPADECVLALRLALDEADHMAGDHCLVTTIDRLDLTRQRRFVEQLEWARRVIAGGQFELYGQPLARADRHAQAGEDGRGEGVDIEVLLRVPNDAGGIEAPAELLAVATRAGLMRELDRAVIAKVFAWYAQNHEALVATDKCAINLSGASVSDGTLPAYIDTQLQRHGLTSVHFAFEVTESEALTDPLGAIKVLESLRLLGFRIAIDDFGTGFATFDYLKRFRVDYVKIDGSFVMELGGREIDNEIVRSIVAVARALGIMTVAEHVWNDQIRDLVTSLGVDFVQGHAIAQPKALGHCYPSDSLML